jgi:UBX domain-containing protein 1
LGPHPLDGRPAPEAAAAGSSASSQQRQKPPAPKRRGIATLSSLGVGGHSHHADDDDEDDDSSDPNYRHPRDLFAGGEKSALAVQDPTPEGSNRKLINDIIKKAKS